MMSERIHTKVDQKFQGYQSLGLMVFLGLTFPIWMPVWLYVRLVHRRPTKRIAKLFAQQRPDDRLLELCIDQKFGKRIIGRITSPSHNQLLFEFHRELDLLTIRESHK